MMNQVVAGPETYSYTVPTTVFVPVSWALLAGPETCSYQPTYPYHQTYYLNLSQGPGYDEPGGGWTRNLLLPLNLLPVPVSWARI